MEWTWLIPIIAFAVWVINNLQQRQREAAKQAAGGGARPAGQRPRPGNSEIDRFLEEINRRRQQQQMEQRQEPPRAQQPPPVRRPSPGRQPDRPRLVETKRRRRVPDPTPAEVLAVEPIVPEVLPATPFEERLAVNDPQFTSRKSTPAHFTQLRKLLATAEGRRTAFLLHEILGPPKSKRQGR